MANKVVICGIDTSTLPKLSNSNLLVLLKEAREGNQSSRDICIISNMRLVLSIVQRFSLKKENIDDVFQVGMVGLIKSIDNFNFELGVQFSTYAVPMIIGEIRRFQRDRTSIKVTRSLRDIAYRALKAKEELSTSNEDEPSLIDISKHIDVPTHLVSDAIKAISDTISIYDPVAGSDGDNLLLLDQLKDKKSCEENWIENTILTESINRLNPREKEIIELRYFIGKTQTEISSEIGISQAQVSRLEKDALTHIKQYL